MNIRLPIKAALYSSGIISELYRSIISAHIQTLINLCGLQTKLLTDRSIDEQQLKVIALECGGASARAMDTSSRLQNVASFSSISLLKGRSSS